MTAFTDDRLREVYATLMARPPATRDACPSADRILALVQQDGDESTRLDTLDHVMACSACKHDFDLLRTIERAQRPDALTTPTPQHATPRVVVASNPRAEHRASPHLASPHLVSSRVSRPWLWTVTALAAAIVVGVGVRNFRGAGAPGDVVRDGFASDTANAIALIEPGAQPVPAHGTLRFVWHPTAGAEQYTLEIVDTAGAVAYAASSGDTAVVLADAHTRLHAGTAYRWWVRAAATSGTRRSEMRALNLTF